MKKIILALLCLPSIALAAQQEITAVPDSPVLPSIGALKDAINPKLLDIDENFDELYPAVSGKETALGNPASDGYVLSSTAAGVRSWIEMTGGAGDDLGSAAYTDVVALWTTCTGYLKSDGTCDTPSGSATYPSAAGVANWNGSAWGTSYTVGTAADNLVQLNASAQLPAVSADLLTITDTGTYFTTDTVGTALQELGGELAEVTQITLDASLTIAAGALSVTYPVTAETWSGSGWHEDTDGLARNDAYDYLHIADTDDDGLPNKVDLSSAGFVKTDANGVLSSASITEVIAGLSLDGGGSDIPDGVKGDRRIPFAGTINTMTILATDASCSVVVDIWKDTYANYPPTVADAITGGGKPTIATSNKGQITGLNISVSAGDVVRFFVDSNDCTGKVALTLEGTRD